MAVNCKNSVMNVNEKLYIDSYFKILQAKKGQPKHDYLDILRDFIRQTDVHCSQQNITKHGAEKFKTELYEEYYKTVDDEQHEGLLPVISESSKINFPLSRPLNLENYCKKFKGFLHSLTNKSSNEIKQYSPNPVINVRKNTSTLSNNPKFKNESLNKNDYPLNKPVSKKKFDSYSEIRPCGSKKFCMQPGVQSKKTPSVHSKSDEIGFVTAKGMYRNPLSKQPSKSSKEETRNEDINLDNDEQSGLKNHETLKHFDKKIVDIVLNEIMDFSPNIKWSDIAGLEFVKTTVQEIVIWPLLRPDIFTGLRAPPRGILLFGPPGTGKTLIGKCIATESKSTFFCISASSLASKWVGESEQMVRVLFAVARLHQPAVIFIDEIDSLLSQRSDKDQDFTRKLKTEFLVQFDGAKTNTEERVLVVGATNRPHELDEAARRRFVKRLYVPLPDDLARCQIIKKLIGAHQHSLSEEDLKKICADTKGYSGSDVAHLCKEAAMGPIRCIGPESITTVSLDDVRPIALCDFTDALRQVRASVVAEDLNYYLEWNKKFGSFGVPS